MRHPLGRSVLRIAAIAAGVCGLAATPAHAKHDVAPYLEVQQVLDADLNGGETFTYTAVAAGIDASVSSKRVEAQVSYRYERRIAWGGNDVGDDDIHTGLARLDYHLTPDVTLEAGGIAARARTDIRGATPLFLTGNDSNVSQIYGFYAGPSFARQFGSLDVTAAYRFGYVNVDNGIDDIVIGAGQPVLDSYSSSTSHEFDASVGMRVGTLPFAWTVSGGLMRENVNRLSQRYDARFIRGDVTLPISYTLALTAGVGYENIEISQRDFRRNPDGTPALTGNGRLIADGPRLLAYDTDGLIYDAGVIWRPNHRTSLEAHVGKRYGETFVTATLEYRVNEYLGVQAGVYNSVQSFGRQLTNRVATLPTAFRNPINPLVGNLDSCVFGDTPGSGGCLDALQSVNTSNYRSRGAYALVSGGRGRWRYGVGASYDQRKYLAPSSATFFSLDGVKDDSFTAEATLTRDLSATASIQGALYGQRYDSGIDNTPATTSLGATATYSKAFSNHLSGQAALGVYNTEQDGFSDTVGTALIGLRYQF